MTNTENQLDMALAALERVFSSNKSKYRAIQEALFSVKTKALRPGNIYFAKRIGVNTSLSGIIDIMKVTDKMQEGIRNIDQCRLPEGQIFIATGISAAYATDTGNSGHDADEQFFTNKIFDPSTASIAEITVTGTDFGVPSLSQLIPNKLLNSEFTLFRGNNIYYQSLFQKLCKENEVDNANGVNVGNSSVVALLPSPIVFDSETLMRAELKMPLAGSTATADHYIRIEWDGFVVSDI